MKIGCYTALITPFSGEAVDQEGLESLVDFQIQEGVTGILAVGTTGESPTLNWQEHNSVIETVASRTRNNCLCIAGAGSNNTAEALAASVHAAEAGADAVLLVDPYYNGPSSLEIRREYVTPIAEAVPETTVIPYVIPGRTGCQLLPEDLAFLFQQYPNVNTVKEATADLGNMKRTRACCGPEYNLLSGDDGMTLQMMSDPEIRAAGVISVASNVVPAAASRLVRLLDQGNKEAASALADLLAPLFGLVTIKSQEQTPLGEVVCRARNPLGIKTLMQLLGMPSGGCRRPLGKMTRNGIRVVLEAARKIQSTAPELFEPIERFFKVDISERLEDSRLIDTLCYPEY